MSETINLAEARRKLPELTDQASAGEAYIVSRRGREMAVLIGIEEYRRLKALERRQRLQDFDLLLAPPTAETMTEDQARELAVQVVHEVRATQYGSQKP
jgi:prevent-host-death family protein